MNLPYHSARLEGKMTRALYRATLPRIVARRIQTQRDLPLEVFSYSGERTLPEQVASIRSFLTHAGRPKRFTVVSDGSYTNASIALLQKIDNCVQVQDEPPPVPSALPEKIRSYLTNHPTGKQLALIMTLPANGPALYTDSDVLFFPEAKELGDLSRTQSVSAFYLADYQFSGDERLVLNAAEKQNPANTGFLLLRQKLDWSLSLARLEKLNGEPSFFTNQTLTHLSLHANGAAAFDRQRFVLQVDDEFIYRDRYAGGSIAIRHYVNQVRHKFWAAIARQFFC
jgi:hypothetical protein